MKMLLPSTRIVNCWVKCGRRIKLFRIDTIYFIASQVSMVKRLPVKEICDK